MSEPGCVVEMSSRRVAEIFPREWVGGVITPASAGEWWGDGQDAATATYGVIGVIDVQRTMLAALTKAGDESIPGITSSDADAPTARTLMLFRQTDTSEDPPIGLIAFNLGILKNAESDRIEELHIHLLSAWVDPSRRRQGYGKHLVAQVLHYIERRLASICGCGVSALGLRVFVDAQITSDGGRRLVEQIHSHFTLMSEGDEEHQIVCTSTWKVSEAVLYIDPAEGASSQSVD